MHYLNPSKFKLISGARANELLSSNFSFIFLLITVGLTVQIMNKISNLMV